ncbi:MAG: flippase [Sulfitobacter sp.]
MVIRGVGFFLGAGATAMLARMLQPESFGAYAFVIAVITLLSAPVLAGLRRTLVRELAYAQARNDQPRMRIVWAWVVRWAMRAMLMSAAALAAWALMGPADAAMQLHLALGVLIFLVVPFPRLLAGILHGVGRTSESQLSEFLLRPLFRIGLMAAIWALWGADALSVTHALLIFVAALVIDAALCLAFLRREEVFALRPIALAGSDTKGLGFAALSFGAIASVQLINNNLDVVMLGMLRPQAEVGIYRAATVLAGIVVFGLGVVNVVLMPQIARLHALEDRAGLQQALVRATRLIAVFAIIGALIIWFAGQPLLALVFGSEFKGGYTALLILTLGQCANAFFGPVALVLNMTGHERLTLIGVSGAVIVNAVLNLLLVPRHGMEGAAVATTVSLVAWNVVLWWVLKRRTGYSSAVF